MNEHCPSCAGPRIPDDPSVLSDYEHDAPWCVVVADECATLDADRARYERRGTSLFHRAAAPVERRLIAASGVALPPGAEMFTRVEFIAPDVRVRTFTRAGLVSADEVTA